MIFAQYKHAVTFAVVILGLAVVVADPGKDTAGDAAPAAQADSSTDLAAPAPSPVSAQQPAPVEADADWYGTTGEEAAAPPAGDPASEATDDGGYDLAPAPAPAPALARAPARAQPRPAPAPAAAQAPGYVPPPPPPQVPPSR